MRGCKYDEQTKANIIASYAVTGNYAETARQLGLPASSVKQIVADNKDKPEYVEIRRRKKEEIAEKSAKAMSLAADEIIRRLETEPESIKTSELTTVFGVMYDKNALANGDSTENVAIAGVDTDMLAELAGFRR